MTRHISFAWLALLALACASELLPPALELGLGLSFDQQDLLVGIEGPSRRHPGGTDLFGRDLCMRTLFGLRMSMAIGLSGAAIACGIGASVGLVGGYVGGLLDACLMRLTDVLYALPMLFLAIVLVALFGNKPLLIFAALGAVGWLTAARMVRAHVMVEVQKPYIAALRLLGVSHVRIVALHIIPNSKHVMAVAFGLSVPTMVMEEAFLSFVGLGIQPPHCSLGALIADGMSLVRLSVWPLVLPASALASLLLLLQRTRA